MSAEVTVIGGGVMGLFTAISLAERLDGPIVLLEQRYLGAGSSGKSGAILRQHYSHEVTVRMARDGLAYYRSFQERYGRDIGFHQTGMVFTCMAADRPSLEANIALQQRIGVDVELLDAAGIRALDPTVRVPDDVIAAYEREAGFVDPGMTLAALGAVAREGGVDVREGVRVDEIVVDGGGRVVAVSTANGETISSRRVVNAGGPWAARLCSRLGVDLPLRAIRPEQAFFRPPEVSPLIFGDLPTGLYWKPEPAGWTRVGKLAYDGDEAVADPDSYDEGVSHAFIDDCRRRLTERLPAFADAVSWGGCGALYTVTPDAHPLIGPVPGIDGLYVVSGFSGHGFKLGPAVGAGLAAMIVGGDPSPLDPGFFAVDRFERGRPVTSAYEYGILG